MGPLIYIRQRIFPRFFIDYKIKSNPTGILQNSLRTFCNQTPLPGVFKRRGFEVTFLQIYIEMNIKLAVLRHIRKIFVLNVKCIKILLVSGRPGMHLRHFVTVS